MELTVSLLAYGEAENLDRLLPEVIRVTEGITDDYEIRIVDGVKSMDNTEAVCRKYHVEYIHQAEPYYGGAYRTAIKCARGRYFVILDADGSHDPGDIQRLYRKMEEGYDVVIGSRYVKGARTENGIISIMMSRCLNWVYRLCLGIKAKDISNSLRIYETRQLQKLCLECENYDIVEEILFKLKLEVPEIRMTEIPITFSKRVDGKSKRNLVKFIISYLKTLYKFIIMRIQYKKHN